MGRRVSKSAMPQIGVTKRGSFITRCKKEESTWELAGKGETNFDKRDEIQVGKTALDELQGLKITMLLSQPNHPPML